MQIQIERTGQRTRFITFGSPITNHSPVSVPFSSPAWCQRISSSLSWWRTAVPCKFRSAWKCLNSGNQSLGSNWGSLGSFGLGDAWPVNNKKRNGIQFWIMNWIEKNERKEQNVNKIEKRNSYPCLFLLWGVLVTFVNLQFLVINFPEQAVQFLLVAPISVEHERDDAQDQKHSASDCCCYFTGIAWKCGETDLCVCYVFRP